MPDHRKKKDREADPGQVIYLLKIKKLPEDSQTPFRTEGNASAGR